MQIAKANKQTKLASSHQAQQTSEQEKQAKQFWSKQANDKQTSEQAGYKMRNKASNTAEHKQK